mmetsp:Transcript_40874/g.108018  ORF Transcript_40874/g.108018 Transcript_40874/m.108018 type:complete len:168 (+) Transcript_40874:28-531(+)
MSAMSLSLLMMSLVGGHALVLTSVRTPAVARSRTILMTEDCATIDLSTDDPVRIAKTLRQAWMEGGVKRGLTGSVLVPGENTVRIVAKGDKKRLASFAEWLETESQMVSKVTMDASCPADAGPFSNKFELVQVSNEANAPWLELLNQATIDVDDASGKTHSSDEGLA